MRYRRDPTSYDNPLLGFIYSQVALLTTHTTSRYIRGTGETQSAETSI
jgi:hypothetical protein